MTPTDAAPAASPRSVVLQRVLIALGCAAAFVVVGFVFSSPASAASAAESAESPDDSRSLLTSSLDAVLTPTLETVDAVVAPVAELAAPVADPVIEGVLAPVLEPVIEPLLGEVADALPILPSAAPSTTADDEPTPAAHVLRGASPRTASEASAIEATPAPLVVPSPVDLSSDGPVDAGMATAPSSPIDLEATTLVAQPATPTTTRPDDERRQPVAPVFPSDSTPD